MKLVMTREIVAIVSIASPASVVLKEVEIKAGNGKPQLTLIKYSTILIRYYIPFYSLFEPLFMGLSANHIVLPPSSHIQNNSS